MAEATDAATATATKVKGLVTLLESLTGKSQDADTTTEASSDPAGARAAVAAYRHTARWILAAFAAVALVVFGTLPFANVTRLEGPWRHLWLVLGLLLVGLGVVLAVRAVASTMTPVSASLGELAVEKGDPQAPADPQAVAGHRPNTGTGQAFTWKRAIPWLRQRLMSWWRRAFTDEARTTEMRRLKGVLNGADRHSHFGPDVTDVHDLIIKILEQDKKRLVELPAAQAAAIKLQTAVDRQTMLEGQLAALNEELVELLAANLPNGQDGPLVVALHRRIGAVSQSLNTAREMRETAMTHAADCGAELAETLARREIYLFHRGMVIDQYGVSLVRATFLRARAMLVPAAVLTLVGATVYSLALPPDPTEDDDEPAAAPAAASSLEPAPAVSLTLDADGDAYRVLPATCGRDERLTGYLTSGLPLLQNGPATVVIASGSCAGHLLRVGEKDGTLAIQDPPD